MSAGVFHGCMSPLASLSLVAYLVGGGLAGLVAAVAMDVSMSRQPEGWTPACISAAIVRRTTPDAVRFRDASVVHHGVGVLAGGLYGLFAFGLGAVVRPFLWSGVPMLAHLSAVVLVTVFIYFFFAHVVLRWAGDVYEERSTAVRGQWLRSALTFALAVTLAGPLLIALFRAVLLRG